jgi:hypothetical protein
MSILSMPPDDAKDQGGLCNEIGAGIIRCQHSWSPDKARRGRQALVAVVKIELMRWTPIIKAANVRAG